MTDGNIYENSHYRVVVARKTRTVGILRDEIMYDSWYEVLNQQTGVVELKVPTLPEAINAAAVMDVTLTNEPWQWFYKEREPEEDPQETIAKEFLN